MTQDIKQRIEKIHAAHREGFVCYSFIEDAMQIIKELTAREEKLVRALDSLCPNSLILALRDLELITREDILDADLENAKMHVGCELQRMENAKATLKELGIE